MVVTVKDILTSDRELVMPELKDLPALDAAAARDWIERWDLQQEVYMPDREERFTALIDAVEAGSGRPDPLVLDLGCGPGCPRRPSWRSTPTRSRSPSAGPATRRYPGCASSTWTCGRRAGRRGSASRPA